MIGPDGVNLDDELNRALAVEAAFHAAKERAGMREEYENARGGNGANIEERPPRFSFVTDGELESQPLPDFLVDGMLVAGSLALLVGAPENYKSFIALGLAASIKAGIPFAGRAVIQGPVLYVLCEGRGMFGLRTRALKQHHHITGDLGLLFMLRPIQLADHGDVSAFIDSVLALPERPILIVIDTLARAAVGLNENRADEMGRLIAGADRIREQTGAAVLLLHHTPRGEERERGSVALRAATDTLLLARADGDFVTLTVERQKDSNIAAPITFRRRIVELEDGRTSVVLIPITTEEQRRPPRGLTDLPHSERQLLEAIARGESKSNKQLAKVAELNDRTLYRALKALRGRGLITRKGRQLTPAGRALVGGADGDLDED